MFILTSSLLTELLNFPEDGVADLLRTLSLWEADQTAAEYLLRSSKDGAFCPLIFSELFIEK